MANWLKQTLVGMIKPKCSYCGGPIADDDVNLRENTMLCRSCGKTSPIKPDEAKSPSQIEPMETWSPDRESVPKPAKPRVRVREVAGELDVRRRSGNMFVGFFLLFWLSGWTAGCVFLVKHVLREPTVEHILFAAPFLVGEIAVFVILPWAFFGFERMRVSSRGVRYCRGMGIVLRRREVPLDDLVDFADYTKVNRNDSGPRESYGLKLVTRGEPICFGEGLPRATHVWLADVIRRHLYAVAPGWAASRRKEGEAAAAGEAAKARETGVETLHRLSMPPKQPHDSRIVLRREAGRVEYRRRHSLSSSLATIGGLTFIALFWNGLVSLPVLELVRHFQILLFFFLIPFEVIGLILLIAWLASLAGPFWREKWVFRPGEIGRRSSVLGIGFTRRYKLTGLDRIELRWGAATKKRWMRSEKEEDTTGAKFSLCLVNEDGSNLVELAGLTEGEARWVAAELFEDFDRGSIRVKN